MFRDLIVHIVDLLINRIKLLILQFKQKKMPQNATPMLITFNKVSVTSFPFKDPDKKVV